MNRKEFIQKSASLGVIPLFPFGINFENIAENNQPMIVRPDLGNSYWYIGRTLLSVLISSEQSGGAFSLVHGYEIQGLEPPPHTHTKEDESFFLINGEIDFTAGDKVMNAKAGDWVFLPRNIEHSFKVRSDKAQVLIHLSPGGFENYFIEMSEPAKEMVIPPRPEGPPDVQRIIETAARYGIIFPKH
jgi:quercetin dioxygenase-like cupin family protein